MANVPLQHHIAFTSKASICYLQKINVTRIKLFCGKSKSSPQESHRTSNLEALNYQQHAQGKSLKPKNPPIGCLIQFSRKWLMSVWPSDWTCFLSISRAPYLCKTSYTTKYKISGPILTSNSNKWQLWRV